MNPAHGTDRGTQDGGSTGSAGSAGSAESAETVLGRLAGACYDRRRTVLVIWILAIIGVTVVAQMVGTHFENKFTAGNTPSQQATNILQATFPSKSGDTADIVFHTTAPITSPANEAAINKVVASVEPLP